MATLATSQAKWQHAPAGTYDRIFYSGMAVAMAATVFVGFAPTFYLRFYFHAPTPSGATSLTRLAQFHGALFSSWVVLFIVQTSLVAKHNVAMHRRLGIAGVVLVLSRPRQRACPAFCRWGRSGSMGWLSYFC
jgi:hypothetical protein